MEFFIPGLLFFLVIVGLTFAIVPKATPMIAGVLSILFLVYGVYDHRRLFADEYRLSTWQDGLKIYAPAIMIIAIILLCIYGIIGFFTHGAVPIPSMPDIALPSPNTITSAVTNTLNNVSSSISNATSNMKNMVNKRTNDMFGESNKNNTGNTNTGNTNTNKGSNESGGIMDTIKSNLGMNTGNNAKRNNTLSRSTLEKI